MKKAFLTTGFIAILLFSSQAFAANTVVDVTGGAEIRGIVTDSQASGYAKVSWDETTFMLNAGFMELTDPVGDDFYEGWLVRKSPFAFISTGKLIKKDGKYHNTYSSTINYSDYNEYVLTIEPNDGDDAPADHILEGMTTVVDAGMMMKKDHMMNKDEMMDKKEMMKDTMMEKKDMMKSEMIDKKEKMMKKMSVRQERIAERIQARIGNLSDAKKALLLERVMNLQGRVSTLNISDAKKASYNEILDVLVRFLKGDEMMDDTMMDK